MGVPRKRRPKQKRDCIPACAHPPPRQAREKVAQPCLAIDKNDHHDACDTGAGHVIITYRKSVSTWSLASGNVPGPPMTSRIPIHEMANARTKKVNTAWRLMKDMMLVIIFSLHTRNSFLNRNGVQLMFDRFPPACFNGQCSIRGTVDFPLSHKERSNKEGDDKGNQHLNVAAQGGISCTRWIAIVPSTIIHPYCSAISTP